MNITLNDFRFCLRTLPQRSIAGFTLIELLIVLVVAAILASIAAPSLTGLIGSQRAKSVATNLHLALTVARSEAARRNADVTVAANSGSWQNGWQIYPTATSTNILHSYAANNGVTINSGGVTTVVYRSSGRIQGNAAVIFVITASSGGSSAARCVSVDLSGRPYVKAGTSC